MAQKIKCEVVLELDSGSYELKINNLSEPGSPVDQGKVLTVIRRVLTDWEAKNIPAG